MNLKPKDGMTSTIVMVDPKQQVSMAVHLTGEEATTTRGRAKCMPGDEYKPEIGAIIALCKSMGVNPAVACQSVLDVYSDRSARDTNKAKVEEARSRVLAASHVSLGVGPGMKIKYGKVKVTPRIDPKALDGLAVGEVKRGRCKLVVDFDDDARDYGVMGGYTKFFDVNGKQLHVGDLVTVEVLNGDVRTGQKWTPLPDMNFVVDERSDNKVTAGHYIWGMCSGCDPKTGKIDKRFKVRKVKDWQQVEIGEKHACVKAEWEDEI